MDIYEEQRLRLKEIRNGLGMSQAQFAAKLPYPLSSIAAIEAGNQKLAVQLVFKLQDLIVSDQNGHMRIVSEEMPKREDEYNLRSEWMFRGTGEPFDFGEIGSSSKLLNLPIFDETKSFPLAMDGVVFYRVKDDSMNDAFAKGDIVAINTKKKEILSGQTYLVRVFDEYLLRMVYNLNSSVLSLVPFNKSIAPVIEVERSEIETVGCCEYLIRKM